MGKKRKSPSQSVIKSENTGHCAVNNGNRDDKGDIKTETKDDWGIVEANRLVDIEKHPDIPIYKEVPDNIQNINITKHKNMTKTKENLEKKIAKRRLHLDAEEKIVKTILDTKLIEINNINSMIDKFLEEENMKLNEVDKLDKELSDLETKIAELKLKKIYLLEESRNDIKNREKYEEKKHKLEDDI